MDMSKEQQLQFKLHQITAATEKIKSLDKEILELQDKREEMTKLTNSLRVSIGALVKDLKLEGEAILLSNLVYFVDCTHQYADISIRSIGKNYDQIIEED